MRIINGQDETYGLIILSFSTLVRKCIPKDNLRSDDWRAPKDRLVITCASRQWLANRRHDDSSRRSVIKQLTRDGDRERKIERDCAREWVIYC